MRTRLKVEVVVLILLVVFVVIPGLFIESAIDRDFANDTGDEIEYQFKSFSQSENGEFEIKYIGILAMLFRMDIDVYVSSSRYDEKWVDSLYNLIFKIAWGRAKGTKDIWVTIHRVPQDWDHNKRGSGEWSSGKRLGARGWYSRWVPQSQESWEKESRRKTERDGDR